MTILIIEDERDLRESFKELFEDKGHIVYLAENGKIGLDLLRAESIDLVLTDIQMPVMTGMDLLREIHKNFAKQAPPIVVMTGGSKYTEKQIYEAGAVAFFDKVQISPDSVLRFLEKSA